MRDPPLPASGFTDLLACATCDKLENIVANEVLAMECRACCKAERKASATASFTSAVLEVCS